MAFNNSSSEAPQPTDLPLVPSWLSAEAKSVDRAQAEQFARLLFEGMDGFVNLRAIEEPTPDGRKANVHSFWKPINSELPRAIGDYVEWCAANGYAAYLLPHPVRENGGGLKDILALRVLPLDIDSGDIDAKVQAITTVMGDPWIYIHSGGIENGQPKVHLYYRLPSDVMPDGFARIAQARAAAARRFGADTKVGNNPAQILRIPGSRHAKATPSLCAIKKVSPYAYLDVGSLVGGQASATGSNVVPFSLDFSDARPRGDIDRVLTQPVHEGAVDDITRFEAASKALGHFIRMVRDGRMTADEAWEAAKGWNAATLVPPWPEERLRTDFDRLVRRDIEDHGPVTKPAIAQTASGSQLTDWYARDRFVGSAPERRWLVDGIIPLGTSGVFAAVGDAGKSMLALRLANIVASHPAPETTPASPAGISDAASFFGQPIIGRGTAVVLTGEDDADEVHRRLETIDPAGEWRAPTSRLIVRPLISDGGARAFITSGREGPQFTAAWAELCSQLEALPDLALVVLDPLTLFVGGDTNDNAIGAAFQGELNRLATKTGATVMLVHHFAKAAKVSSLSDARAAIRGASAWVDNGRWGIVLWEADQDSAYSVLKALGRAHLSRQAGLVYFGGLTKGNAPGAKTLRTLVRGETGILEDCTDHLAALTPKKRDVDDALYAGLLKVRESLPRFSFTGSASALWDAWGSTINRLDLPITKNGKAKGKHAITDVLVRLVDAGKVQRCDEGKSPARYELVLPE